MNSKIKPIRNKIYNGSSKILYQADEEYALIMDFTDNLKLEDGKQVSLSGKGVINNNISAFIMNHLDMAGIENHFIEKINMRQQLVQLIDIFPLVISVTTIASGRYVREFGMEEGYVFDNPIIDFKIKNSEFKYPAIGEHQITSFGWLTENEVRQLKLKAIRVHDFLSGIFAGIGVRLVDCNLEFGRVFNGEEFIIMLADEITPDNCRLWDISTNQKLGYEAINNDQEGAIATYKLIAERFNLSSN